MKQDSKKNMPEQEGRGGRDASLERDKELPSYQEITPTFAPSHIEDSAIALGPTVSSPFSFPATDVPPPDYTPSTTKQRRIAIPQEFPDPTSPFISAYPPSLLNYGIPSETWYSFLAAMSAFLTASISKRAISHAATVATSVANVPHQLGKDLAKNVKDTAKGIGKSAKQGNLVGVVGGLIGGTVGLTVGTAVRLTGSILSLPGTAINSSTNRQTPRERAEAYTTVANKDWFHKRGLHAQLLTTNELSHLVGVPVQQLVETANAQPGSTHDKLAALRDCIEPLEMRTEGSARPSSRKPSTPEYPLDTKSKAPVEDPSSTTLNGEASSSQAKSMNTEESAVPLRLTDQTLWLVLIK